MKRKTQNPKVATATPSDPPTSGIVYPSSRTHKCLIDDVGARVHRV
jgi:hypothetical protein